jgi:hypothetical protein
MQISEEVKRLFSFSIGGGSVSLSRSSWTYDSALDSFSAFAAGIPPRGAVNFFSSDSQPGDPS